MVWSAQGPQAAVWRQPLAKTIKSRWAKTRRLCMALPHRHWLATRHNRRVRILRHNRYRPANTIGLTFLEIRSWQNVNLDNDVKQANVMNCAESVKMPV